MQKGLGFRVCRYICNSLCLKTLLMDTSDSFARYMSISYVKVKGALVEYFPQNVHCQSPGTQTIVLSARVSWQYSGFALSLSEKP